MKNLKGLVKGAESYINQKSSGILTGLALVGLCVTVYKAYKAGPVIKSIIEEKKKDLRDTDPEDKKTKNKVVKEAVKEVVPVVAPVVVGTVLTSACILGSNTISSKKIAVLSAGYTLAEKSLDDLNGKMKEVLGEKKAREVKDAIVADKMKEAGPVNESKVIITGNGDVLCKDLYSGRYFRSNADRIGRAIRELSADCQSEMYVELNDLYTLLGIPNIPLGSDLGWTVDDLVRGELPITISAQISEDGQPCLCLDYDIRVRPNLRDLH